jgi:hypothetical protein
MVSRKLPRSSLRRPVFRRLIGVEVLGFEFDVGCLFRGKRTVYYVVKGVGAIHAKVIVTSTLLLILRERSTLEADVFLCGRSRARTRRTWSFLARGFGRWFGSSGRDSDRCRHLLLFLKTVKLSLIDVNDLVD